MVTIVQSSVSIVIVLLFQEYYCHTFNIIVKSSPDLEKLAKEVSTAQATKSSNLVKKETTNEIPTVKEAAAFNATADAIILRKATDGFGTDEDAIINVLTKRSNRQRHIIAQMFKKQYEKELRKTLLDETSGSFQDVLLALLSSRTDLQARRLYMDGDSDPKVLIDVLCMIKTNAEMRDLTVAFKRFSQKSLESLLAGRTKGVLKKLLINLSHADRDEDKAVKQNLAVNDSQTLFKAGEQKTDLKESVFIKILTRRSFPQISLMLESYENFTNQKFENLIMAKFSGDTKRAFLALIQNSRNKTASYFADRIHESLFPKPIHDDITFIVVSRAEKDLGNIKAEYNKKYKRSLAKDINEKVTEDTDYKNTLLSLIG